MVDLTLPLFGSLITEITEDAIVEDDVPGGTRLDRIIRALAALDTGTEQLKADVHLPPHGLDKGT